MKKESDTELVDLGQAHVFFVQGIARVEAYDTVFRTIFFEYRELAGRRVRIPNVEIIRPIASYVPNQLARLLHAQHPRALMPAGH